MPYESTTLVSSADTIVDTVREPVLVLSADLRVRKANRSFFRTFKVNPEETVGQLIYDLGNHQWDIPSLRKLLEEVLLENAAFDDFEVDHDFPVIGRKCMLLNARRISHADNATESIVLAIEDITDRMRAELNFQESEKRYRGVVELMPAGAYTVDAGGVITFYNHQAAALWGRAPRLGDTDERFCGATRLLRPDGAPLPHDQTPVAAILQNGICVREMEVIIERLDGSRVYVRVNIDPIRDSNDRIIGAINVFHDITEHKRAEVALETSEVRYRRLFQSAKDGILILDAETGKVIDANPFMTALLGYSHDEFVQKELWEIGLFQDIQANQSAFRELQEKGYLRYEHLPLETGNGQKVDVEFVSNVYAEKDRRVVQCNIRDITERCRLERQTQEQSTALADLNRRKDEFLAMLSHELRNPLAPILSAVQLLQLQSGEGPIQQKAGAIIERQVGQLTHLVDDLMEVSRAITGRIELSREEVALGGIVERAVETTRPLIDQRRQDLTVSFPPDPIWLNADAARLEQVVTNLLTNAAKYTPEGGHIWISVRQECHTAMLRVRDTGLGIAPTFLPHIFELFTQAERSCDRSQGGLGIGLALVKRLVEMHEGTIEVSSTLGKGSEFVVSLPVHLPGAPSLVTQAPPTEMASPSASSVRVLIVDDNVDAATTLEMLVQETGHRAWVAHTGPTALAAALKHRPDVMLLDIGLPGYDGYEVAQRIRRHPLLHRIVLVALTGYGQEMDRQRSQATGFDHHLIKPADFEKVRQILTTLPAGAT